jgi:hypothetical protein
MAPSAIARFTRSIRRRCMARPAFAALLALGLSGAVAGSAMAISPTVDTGLVFRGGVNIIDSVGPTTLSLAYTVPAGRKFLLTDIVISNTSNTTPASALDVYTGEGAGCAVIAAARTNFLKVPAGGTIHLPFITGIGFAAGQTVCIRNGGSVTTHWTVRGFLFE